MRREVSGGFVTYLRLVAGFWSALFTPMSAPEGHSLSLPVSQSLGNRGDHRPSAAVFLAGIAVGAAAVEIAYAGRAGTRWGVPLYWSGEVLLYGTAAAGALRRRMADGALFLLMIALGVATFLIKVAYSPVQFTFVDEFQHWRSLMALLGSHHLFHPNPSLPVSPDFPGLEIATSAVIYTTGLSPFAAGLLVTGFAHVLLSGAVYVLCRAVLHSPRLAAVATIVFATEPHFQYFDAIFGYQTVALPLMIISLIAGVKLLEDRRQTHRASWLVAGSLSAGALLFTHHLTMFALLLVLGSSL